MKLNEALLGVSQLFLDTAPSEKMRCLTSAFLLRFRFHKLDTDKDPQELVKKCLELPFNH